MTEKYQSQIQFEKIGKEGQEKIRNATVAIIGMGALGTRCAELLCRAGIGRLQLFDKDIIEKSNLQRQTLYTEKDIGAAKATTAKKKLEEINKDVKIEARNQRIDEDNIKGINTNIIIDGTDNMETRGILNQHCINTKKILISGAVAGSIGTIYTTDCRACLKTERPCLQCVFGRFDKHPDKNCETEGILNTTATIIAAMQANEAIRIIVGEPAEEELIRIDIWKNNFEKIKVKKNPKCSGCVTEYKKSSGEKMKEQNTKEKNNPTKFEIKLCKTKAAFSTKLKTNTKLNLKKIVEEKEYKVITDTPVLLVIEDEKEESGEIIVYEYGELLFKTLKDTEKLKKIAEKIYHNYAK